MGTWLKISLSMSVTSFLPLQVVVDIQFTWEASQEGAMLRGLGCRPL